MWSLVGTFRERTLSGSTVHMDIVMKTSMVRDVVQAQMPGHPANVQIIHKCTCFRPTTIFFIAIPLEEEKSAHSYRISVFAGGFNV